MVKLAFALALYSEFLTRMSKPLGAPDTFSGACRPSLTTHQMLSPFCKGKRRSFQRMVLHCCLHSSWRNCFDGFHLRSTLKTTPQHQTVVNFRGVFSSRWRSQAYSPGSDFIRLMSGTLGISLLPWCKPALNRQGITLPSEPQS